MGCNCGKAKADAMTAASIEAARLEMEAKMNAETAKAASGEHDPKPLVRVVRR